MTTKINGFAFGPDQALTGSLQSFTVTVTGADLTAAAANGKQNFDTVVNVIKTIAQPVIIGAVTATTFTFTVEHGGAFPDLVAFAELIEEAVGATAVTMVAAAYPSA